MKMDVVLGMPSHRVACLNTCVWGTVDSLMLKNDQELEMRERVSEIECLQICFAQPDRRAFWEKRYLADILEFHAEA